MRNAIFLVLIVVAVAVASFMGFQLSQAGTLGFWALLGLPTVALAVLGLIRAHKDGELRGLLRPAWGDATRGVLGALAFFAVAYGFARATSGGIKESWLARIYLQLGDPSLLRGHAVLVAVAIIVVAAAEEIVWRGLATTLLAEKLGSRRAWIFAAILYSVAHLPTLWALRDPEAGLNPVLPLAALAGGLLWGGMTRYFERLPPAIIAHALFDWIVIMTFRLWGVSV